MTDRGFNLADVLFGTGKREKLEKLFRFQSSEDMESEEKLKELEERIKSEIALQTPERVGFLQLQGRAVQRGLPLMRYAFIEGPKRFEENLPLLHNSVFNLRAGKDRYEGEFRLELVKEFARLIADIERFAAEAEKKYSSKNRPKHYTKSYVDGLKGILNNGAELYNTKGFSPVWGLNLYVDDQPLSQIRFPAPTEKGHVLYKGDVYFLQTQIHDEPIFIDEDALRFNNPTFTIFARFKSLSDGTFKPEGFPKNKSAPGFLGMLMALDKLNFTMPELRFLPVKLEQKYKARLEKAGYKRVKTFLVTYLGKEVTWALWVHEKVLPLLRKFRSLTGIAWLLENKKGQNFKEFSTPVEINAEAYIRGVRAHESNGLFDGVVFGTVPDPQEINRAWYALFPLVDLYGDLPPAQFKFRYLQGYWDMLLNWLQNTLLGYAKKRVRKFSVSITPMRELAKSRIFNYERITNPWKEIRHKNMCRFYFSLTFRHRKLAPESFYVFCPIDTSDKDPGANLQPTLSADIDKMGRLPSSVFRETPSLARKLFEERQMQFGITNPVVIEEFLDPLFVVEKL